MFQLSFLGALMATHSIILAWRIPWTEEPGRLQPMGSQRVGHDWVTNTFTFKTIFNKTFQLSSAQLLSYVRLFVTPWTAAHLASLPITNSQSLLKLMSIWVGDAIQPSHPLSSPSPPAFNLSHHQSLFKWVTYLKQLQECAEGRIWLIYIWQKENRILHSRVWIPEQLRPKPQALVSKDSGTRAS